MGALERRARQSGSLCCHTPRLPHCAAHPAALSPLPCRDCKWFERADDMYGDFSACRAVLRTPIPFAYISHLRTFMVMWLAAVPWSFCIFFDWWVRRGGRGGSRQRAGAWVTPPDPQPPTARRRYTLILAAVIGALAGAGGCAGGGALGAPVKPGACAQRVSAGSNAAVQRQPANALPPCALPAPGYGVIGVEEAAVEVEQPFGTGAGPRRGPRPVSTRAPRAALPGLPHSASPHPTPPALHPDFNDLPLDMIVAEGHQAMGGMLRWVWARRGGAVRCGESGQHAQGCVPCRPGGDSAGPRHSSRPPRPRPPSRAASLPPRTRPTTRSLVREERRKAVAAGVIEPSDDDGDEEGGKAGQAYESSAASGSPLTDVTVSK